MNTDPIIEIKVTGYLPITAKDAAVLEHMANVDPKRYQEVWGTAFADHEYHHALHNLREAARKVTSKERIVQKAAFGEHA